MCLEEATGGCVFACDVLGGVHGFVCVSYSGFSGFFFSAPAVLVLMELPALQPLMFILAALIELRTRCGHAMQ